MSFSQFAPLETTELIDKWLHGISQETLHARIVQTDFKAQSENPPRTLDSQQNEPIFAREHCSLRYQHSIDDLQCLEAGNIRGKLLEQTSMRRTKTHLYRS